MTRSSAWALELGCRLVAQVLGDWEAYVLILPNVPSVESAWMVHIEPDLPAVMALSMGTISSPSTSPTMTRSASWRLARWTR